MEFFNDAKGDKYHSPEKQFFPSALPFWVAFYHPPGLIVYSTPVYATFMHNWL